MRPFLERALLIACPWLLVACAGGAAGSSAAGGTPEASADAPLDSADGASSGKGAVAITYELFGGAQIDTIQGVLTNGTTSLSFSAALADAGGDTFTEADVPAGAGYSLVLTANTVDGLSSCSGSAGVTLDGGVSGGAPFIVSAGATTPVSVQLICHMTQTSACATAPAGACPSSCYLNQVVQPGGAVSAPSCDIMPEECVSGGGAWSVSARSCGVGVVVEYLDGGSVPPGAFCCTYQLAGDGAAAAEAGGDP